MMLSKIEETVEWWKSLREAVHNEDEDAANLLYMELNKKTLLEQYYHLKPLKDCCTGDMKACYLDSLYIATATEDITISWKNGEPRTINHILPRKIILDILTNLYEYKDNCEPIFEHNNNIGEIQDYRDAFNAEFNKGI